MLVDSHHPLFNDIPSRKSYETRDNYNLDKVMHFFTYDSSSHWPKNATFNNIRLVCKPFIKKK